MFLCLPVNMVSDARQKASLIASFILDYEIVLFYCEVWEHALYHQLMDPFHFRPVFSDGLPFRLQKGD